MPFHHEADPGQGEMLSPPPEHDEKEINGAQRVPSTTEICEAVTSLAWLEMQRTFPLSTLNVNPELALIGASSNLTA